MIAGPRSATPSRRSSGFTLVELLFVLLILAGVAWGLYFLFHQRLLRLRCEENLVSIYAALDLYEIERGSLPRLAFYPDDPKQDQNSLITALQPYGVPNEAFVCPALPPSLQAQGLTYIWNVQLNGKKLRGPGAPTWVLVEMNALSATVPAPHLGHYNVLYTDGRVRSSREPPAGLK